ncbi:hypothetical protein C8R44DRAFT_973685 [Mycena epipterygia]|nr:hypothetical protein C8R44DRAFT_973685 [Mycena epipterygia]
MPPRQPVDLKKVGKLFAETLATIRDNNPDKEGLEPQAIEWLKAQRYNIMRQIEASYYQLDRSRDTPLSQPSWVNPSQPLYVITAPIPGVLKSYEPAFVENLATLMKDCGFQNSSTRDSLGLGICVTIYFPAGPRVAAPNPPAAPQRLLVEDEFSRMAGKNSQGDRKPSVSAFAATDFARLLEGTREESASNSKATTSKKRRASGPVKAESDDEGPRLRSVTRASSAATLRSSSGSVRRSGRKRVKKEE